MRGKMPPVPSAPPCVPTLAIIWWQSSERSWIRTAQPSLSQISDPKNPRDIRKWLLFTSLSFGVNCDGAVDNKNKFWYLEMGFCHKNTMEHMDWMVGRLEETVKNLRGITLAVPIRALSKWWGNTGEKKCYWKLAGKRSFLGKLGKFISAVYGSVWKTENVSKELSDLAMKKSMPNIRNPTLLHLTAYYKTQRERWVKKDSSLCKHNLEETQRIKDLLDLT